MKQMKLLMGLLIALFVLSVAQLMAQQAKMEPMRQAGPSYFYNQIYYGPTGVQQLPAIITGTATNGQATASFGYTFKAAPFVLVQWLEAQTAGGGTNQCWATNVTTTTFCPKTTMSVGGAFTNFNWLAIGLLY